MSEFAGMTDEIGRDQAAKAARAAIDIALLRCSTGEREAFWNAIGLYYTVRRHSGGDDRETDGADG